MPLGQVQPANDVPVRVAAAQARCRRASQRSRRRCRRRRQLRPPARPRPWPCRGCRACLHAGPCSSMSDRTAPCHLSSWCSVFRAYYPYHRQQRVAACARSDATPADPLLLQQSARHYMHAEAATHIYTGLSCCWPMPLSPRCACTQVNECMRAGLAWRGRRHGSTWAHGSGPALAGHGGHGHAGRGRRCELAQRDAHALNHGLRGGARVKVHGACHQVPSSARAGGGSRRKAGMCQVWQGTAR